ncbi:MAG: cyclic nucleotide-binding protein [bacterium]|nr:MAG: cyclic nucleotide-binding protein [bacterium]
MNPQALSSERLYQTFQFLHSEKGIIDQIVSSAVVQRIPKGTIMLFEGDKCQHFGLLFSGVVRIYKVSETGREITLYRVSGGECCVLIAFCIMYEKGFPAHAIVEQDVEVAIIPSDLLRDWIQRYDGWRKYIFSLLSKRFSQVLGTVEEVAFRRMDIRIAELLVGLVQNGGSNILTTHQDLALDLGTSREVVSRILKHFEEEKLISLKRKEIIVLNLEGLIKKIP